jgi:hypothetical protein
MDVPTGALAAAVLRDHDEKGLAFRIGGPGQGLCQGNVCGREEDAGLNVVLRKTEEREKLQVVINEAAVVLVLKRSMVEPGREREAATPACASEQAEESDAGALVGGTGEATIGTKIAAGEGVREGLCSTTKIGQRIRCLNDVIDEGVVAKKCCAKTPGSDGYRGAGASLFDGFVDGREMNAASERKHVFEDEYAVYVFRARRDTAAAQEMLRGHKDFGREIHHDLLQRHCWCSFRALFEEDARVW